MARKAEGGFLRDASLVMDPPRFAKSTGEEKCLKPFRMQVSHVKLMCSVRFVVHADPSEVKGVVVTLEQIW
jgi:hypothetical protein